MYSISTRLQNEEARVRARLAQVQQALAEQEPPRTAAQMLAVEEAGQALGREIADLYLALNLLRVHGEESFHHEALGAAHQRYRQDGGTGRLRHKGWREVELLLRGGTRLRLVTPYLRLDRRGAPGRGRGTGKRQATGSGGYPLLQHLGVHDLATPATTSEVARQVVLCGSYAEAQEQLARSGLRMHLSTLTAIAVAVGQRALAWRNQALEEARTSPLPASSLVEGLRLLVSLDGGRAKTRATKRGARVGKNKRRPFTSAWREPRVLTVTVIGKDGRQDRRYRPLYEVSLGDARRVCALLEGLLRLLGADRAAEVVFVSDGAEWMGERIPGVMTRAGIPAEKVSYILDYYHATEYISEALALSQRLSALQQQLVGETLRRTLREEAEGVERVLQVLDGEARGKAAKKIRKKIQFLKDHRDRMGYAAHRAAKRPIGSGVVESAVRRIINLRFKSASMAWREDHLEPLLYLRALLKAGRWDDLVHADLHRRHWIATDLSHDDSSGQPFRLAA